MVAEGGYPRHLGLNFGHELGMSGMYSIPPAQVFLAEAEAEADQGFLRRHTDDQSMTPSQIDIKPRTEFAKAD